MLFSGKPGKELHAARKPWVGHPATYHPSSLLMISTHIILNSYMEVVMSSLQLVVRKVFINRPTPPASIYELQPWSDVIIHFCACFSFVEGHGNSSSPKRPQNISQSTTITDSSPHQDETKQGWRCNHTTWYLVDF